MFPAALLAQMGAATAVLIRASVIQTGEPRLENQSEHLGEERLIGQDANINKETLSGFYFYGCKFLCISV